MRVIHKQRCLGAGFALKLSKFFKYQGLINKNMEQLSLNPRELQSFFRQKETPVFRVLVWLQTQNDYAL